MTKFFNTLHYAYFIFALAAFYFIAHATIFNPENRMEETGTGVFLMGIAFALGSMGDIRKVSKKEEILFSNPVKFKKKINYLKGLGILMIIVALLFISIKFINVGNLKLAEDFYNLGFNTFPIVIAIFFELKQLNDKKLYYDLLKE